MTNNIFDKIQTRLWQYKQPVTARWVCYEYICQMAAAQKVLSECKDANKDKLSITWLIEGITASSGQRTVRIVADSQAADVKLGFSEVLSEQIYSLTPSMEVSDAGSLIAGDVEQARQMMSALLANNKAESDGRVEAFLHNGCSNVKGVPLVREVVKRKPRPAQPAPPESRKPPLARPKAASAPAAAATDKAAGKQEVVKSEPAVKAEPAKGAKGKSAAKNPLANSFSKSASKKTAAKPASKSAAAGCASVKQEKEEPVVAAAKKEPEDTHMAGDGSDDDAPPAQAKARPSKGSQQVQVLDDDEDDEGSPDACPLPTKKPATTARQNFVLEDSDDDGAAANDASGSEKKPLQIASKQPSSAATKSKPAVKAAPKKAPSVAKSKPAQLDSDMENIEQVKSEADVTEPSAQKEETGGGNLAPAGSHPEYGAPPHPDAEIVMIGSKPVWQYINDKGEEVTLEAKKPGAEKPAVPKPQVPSKRAKPEAHEDSAQGAEDSKAAKKKKPATKHQKAAVQASDIRNLFGKKK